MAPIDMSTCRAFCERRQLAHMLSSQPLDLERPAPILRYEPQERDTRPPAPSRDPCRRCNTRGDIGCAHQRPYSAASVTLPAPGQRTGRRRYDCRAFGTRG